MRYLIGIGNYYGLDDSIGLRVAEAVAERGLDRDFQAIDMGGNLVDLVHYLADEGDSVLIVDSARMGAVPGAYAFFDPTSAVTRREHAGLSTHEGDLLKVLEFARSLVPRLARVTVLGIEPARIEQESGLSLELEQRFEEYVSAAVSFFAEDAAGEILTLS